MGGGGGGVGLRYRHTLLLGVITGNGEYFDLRAAPQAQRKKRQRVGLFLSRVRPDFQCRDVVSHVRQVNGPTVDNCIGDKEICDMWQTHYKQLLNSVVTSSSK